MQILTAKTPEAFNSALLQQAWIQRLTDFVLNKKGALNRERIFVPAAHTQ